MNTKIPKVVGLLASMAIVLLATGCVEIVDVEVGDLHTESPSVELDGAESVHVEIEMVAGDLKVAGGADELLNADFTYNVAAWKPEIKYSVSGSQGTLIVQPPEERHRKTYMENLPSDFDWDSFRNEWDLRLSSDVPMNLTVDLGAGEGNLELGSLNLTSFEIDMGAGAVVIDLIGDWKNDLDADIAAGVGKLTLRLPSDVGTRLEVDVGVGRINAPDLTREGNVYINDAYGKSDVTLSIDIEGGVGEINLELEGVSTKSKGGKR